MESCPQCSPSLRSAKPGKKNKYKTAVPLQVSGQRWRKWHYVTHVVSQGFRGKPSTVGGKVMWRRMHTLSSWKKKKEGKKKRVGKALQAVVDQPFPFRVSSCGSPVWWKRRPLSVCVGGSCDGRWGLCRHLRSSWERGARAEWGWAAGGSPLLPLWEVPPKQIWAWTLRKPKPKRKEKRKIYVKVTIHTKEIIGGHADGHFPQQFNPSFNHSTMQFDILTQSLQHTHLKR